MADIPCYNSAEYMENCVNHLLKLNSNDDIEILIVDDGSQDNTLDIGRRLEKKYPAVIKAIHQENGGHGQAVNTGLKNAHGLYFKVVDSDDWLDVDGTKPIMDYVRDQAKNVAEGGVATDLVIGNYVYNKVHEKKQTPINYCDALPEHREFGWDDIKKFKISEYILMHSVVYRTDLLKDINLKLPKHTFYVDNIFVYVPLPHVKTAYYINTNMYMYYIGREDQSVNEDVMKSRIDQQLKVTRLMIDSTDFESLNNIPKLRRYMLNYLSMMMCICTVFLRMINTEESEEKRKEI